MAEQAARGGVLMTPDTLPWYVAVPASIALCTAYVITVLRDMRRDRNRRG